jgi:predicted secreted protein
MSSPVFGNQGNAKIGTNLIHEITKWSLDISRATKETTSFTDDTTPLQWQTFIAGLRGASGKLEGNLAEGDTNGQDALWSAFLTDTPITLNLVTDKSATPSVKEFTVSALITKFSTAGDVNNITTAGYEFVVTGAVTRV